MSDKPIAVGDLVVVVRTACCDRALGFTFKVGSFVNGRGYQCLCGVRCPDEPLAIEAWGPNTGSGPVSCLKRIPPMGELEGERKEESLRDPQPTKETA